ncbi:hypothetical protein F4776DRAFT_606657 [Hypoxylon sp. NC0597]|nr:hypothetical protein F4776DRAFT_606657 [Hypoxylon sp. NC0597]
MEKMECYHDYLGKYLTSVEHQAIFASLLTFFDLGCACWGLTTVFCRSLQQSQGS